MAEKKLKHRWEFWTWTWPKGCPIEESVWELQARCYHRWPVGAFEKKAASLGYRELRTDDTLIGGYFANKDGNLLVCVPAGTDPKTIYQG
jgi:hypothetical protein